ncbi:hypothetical protein L1887_17598 [Cichorium endivia]|nr:hypothetical protein L1887_17598 [Cichorium endivia]
MLTSCFGQWEAIVYMVCVEADVFVPSFDRDGKGRPNFASVVMGHRLYQSATAKSFRLDRSDLKGASTSHLPAAIRVARSCPAWMDKDVISCPRDKENKEIAFGKKFSVVNNHLRVTCVPKWKETGAERIEDEQTE